MRERERDRERERQRQTETDRQTDRQTDRDRGERERGRRISLVTGSVLKLGLFCLPLSSVSVAVVLVIFFPFFLSTV